MKPTSYLACALAVVAIAGCSSKQGDAATNAPLNVKAVPPPKGGDWTTVVSATPAGGFRMGNPNAKLTLIEYGSLTCPHCREFDEKGVPPLIANYVKTGQLSWEFRNYVRDAFDLTATLIARCNGANSFFPLSRALYKDQPTWVAKVQETPPAQMEQLQNLPPNQQFLQMAKIAGFQDWAAMRGVPVAKSVQCLTDENSVNQLVQMTSDATTQYPDFPGTPTFILNGKMLEKTATWETLEPQLRSAMGERG
jgi:protein-disulfide isomerase